MTQLETATEPRPTESRVEWRPSYRIVPARFPPIQLFERVAAPEDLDAVIAVESLTNPRLRQEVGELSLVAPADRISGPGASFVMAAFTHVAPVGGRFTDGSFGAYYAARDRATAVSETVYHRQRFMAATREPPMELDMRVLKADLRGDLVDLRGLRAARPDLYASTEYGAGQALARRLRAEGAWGIVYESVRHEGGECAAVLRPPVLSRCRQAEHLTYVWDGERICRVYEKRATRRTR